MTATKQYEVACHAGRFYYRVRRAKPNPLTGAEWTGWRGPFQSAKEAKRQAILFLQAPVPRRLGEEPNARLWTGAPVTWR